MAIGTAVAILIPIIMGLAADAANTVNERKRQQYNLKIQQLIDLAGNEREQLINELSKQNEDINRLVSDLGYATRGGSTFNYRNKKLQQYVQSRKASLERQEQINRQQAALNQLIK